MPIDRANASICQGCSSLWEFDHASSLGRELLDDRRNAMLLDREGVARYVLRGRGGIFYEQNDAKGENPLQLALKAARNYPAYFAPVLSRLRHLHGGEMYDIVSRVPESWMNDQSKEFCCRLLSTTLEKLKEGHP